MAAKQKPQTATPPLDAEAMAKLYADIAEKSGELLGKFMARGANGVPVFNDELGIAKAFCEAWQQMLANPARIAEMQMKLWQDYAALWQGSMLKMFGQEASPVAQPDKADRRFRDE